MATAIPAAVRVIAHDTIGSTNAEALTLARGGERGPLWITAVRQTAGRGRRGRIWVSEPGNLYTTLLLTGVAPERASELSFVAALALHDAVGARIPGLARRLTLKWPNDGLIDGCKFAGILIEGEGAAVAIGIGVNCAHHPGDTAFPATDLAAAGVRATPDSVFESLKTTMGQRLEQWNHGAGFAAVRHDWLDRAHALGKTLRIAMADRQCEGRFESIDEAGRMMLRRKDGAVEIVTVGDVLPAQGRA